MVLRARAPKFSPSHLELSAPRCGSEQYEEYAVVLRVVDIPTGGSCEHSIAVTSLFIVMLQPVIVEWPSVYFYAMGSLLLLELLQAFQC